MSHPRVDICTIIAKNYVAQARVLTESFRAHHPEGRCFVLVLDETEGYIDPAAEPFELLTPADLRIEDFDRMAAAYDVLELSTAVKPWLLRVLMERTPGRGIVYLDPDIEVFSSLEAIEELMGEHGLVLIPHVTAPMPRDGRKPSETDILIAGTYNLGFIGLGDDDAAQELLDWWSERLRTDCRIDPEHGYFVDQRWMDFAPGIVPRLKILRDPGYDLAYWNLPSRRLERDGDAYLVDGRPLRFYHYSGYDPERRDHLSRHQDRIVLRADPVLAGLCDRYGDALIDHGYLEAKAWPYTYGTMADGTALTRPMRRLLVRAAAEDGLQGSVFEAQGARELVAWLNAPAPAGGAQGVTRYLHAIYEERPDLQRIYPDLDGADGAGLLGWARVHGRHELRVSDALLPDPPREPVAQPRARPKGIASAQADQREWGVNVAGYFNSELGVGEAARHVIDALDAAGVPVAPVGLVAPLSRQGHHFPAGSRDFPFPVNLICVNADGLPGFISELGTEFAEHRYSIGLWFWEVSLFPERWTSSFDDLDEVWAATDHVAGALEAVSPIPVTKVTVPIAAPAGPLLSRSRLGLPAGFCYLFAFDYNSVFERKNPLALVDAFTRAFPRVGQASLVLKSINHEHARGEHDRLLAAVAHRPDIHVIDRYVSSREKNSIIAACDCYVSLHRSEGLGITMGEAMAHGRPVIATGYSGNLDFMTEENSWLVRHALVPIGPGADPYPPEGEWAEPDVEHAAHLMREVFDDPAAAALRGLRGKADLAATHSPAAAGATMVRRLGQLRLDFLRPGSEASGARALHGLGTGHIREKVRGGAESRRAAGGRARTSFRDAVLRVMRPYTAFELEVDELVLSELDDLIEATGRGFELTREESVRESTLLARLRGLEAAVHQEIALAHEDLAERLDRALEQMAADDIRLKRLERERTRLDRWPVEVPWTHEYVAAHRSFVAYALDDAIVMNLFARGRRLPEDFGVGLDERVVEYPWLFAQRLGGDALDAGSVLNHAHILERVEPMVARLTVATLVSEEPALPLDAVTFQDADLRALPFQDASFDTVVCLSTLEHVGMDNAVYGSDAPRTQDPSREALRAAAELRRVLRPGGRLLVSVPYGAGEDLGWVRTLEREELEALAAALSPGEVSVVVYRYGVRGWQLSDLDEAAGATYRDFTADQRPVQDAAAAARAVACIRVVAP